ncbi:AAA family ATPase [uncultured Schumannella sp.]|uniref:AAA family ATPase n=1 Tax=uncultured Schumannella sp. TaxID=1195956 RepID=UPI0025F6D207|nr:AAA family ATPase [uncultured Schumannella sp.]
MSRYFLVTRSADFGERLHQLLGSRLTSVAGEQLARGVGGVAEQASPRHSVALLGPAVSFQETRELTGALTERYPGIGLVIVHEGTAELEDWVDDLGIHAVLDPRSDDPTITQLLDRLDTWWAAVRGEAFVDAESEPAPGVASGEVVETDAEEGALEPALPEPIAESARRAVVAVVAPKGGQGKTTMAINLATALAEVAPNSVVLVDADLQFGDIANSLELPVNRTVSEIVERLGDEMAIKTAIVRHPDGFFVIPAPVSPELADAVRPAQVSRLVQELAAIFRYVVIDTTPGLGENSLAVVEAATDLVLVSTLSVPSLRALHSELAVLASIELLPARRYIVLNQVDRVSGLTVSDAETILGASVEVTVPRSPAVVLASNRGRPLLRDDSRDAAAQAIRDLAARIDLAVVVSRRRTHRRFRS